MRTVHSGENHYRAEIYASHQRKDCIKITLSPSGIRVSLVIGLSLVISQKVEAHMLKMNFQITKGNLSINKI